jgi:hypothetical protein
MEQQTRRIVARMYTMEGTIVSWQEMEDVISFADNIKEHAPITMLDRTMDHLCHK